MNVESPGFTNKSAIAKFVQLGECQLHHFQLQQTSGCDLLAVGENMLHKAWQSRVLAKSKKRGTITKLIQKVTQVSQTKDY